jgi:hypothetical protein
MERGEGRGWERRGRKREERADVGITAGIEGAVEFNNKKGKEEARKEATMRGQRRKRGGGRVRKKYV